VSALPPSPPPPPDSGGAPPPPDYSRLPPPPPRDSDFAPDRFTVAPPNKFATLSLLCSSLGWLICGFGALPGVYFGFRALNQIKSTGERGRKMAIAGIVIGLVMFVGVFISFIQQIMS
jgi:Domain of unknown function (DUF4190)